MKSRTLAQIMASTGLTRQQVKDAVRNAYGTYAPDTWAYKPAEADKRLAELFTAMRESRRMIGPLIETAKQAGELRRLIQKHAPVDSGELRDSFNDPASVQIMPDGSVSIDSACPYARIQDLGGWTGRNHATYIPPQHYVGDAILEYNANHAEENNLKYGAIAGGEGLASLVTRGAALMAAFKGAA